MFLTRHAVLEWLILIGHSHWILLSSHLFSVCTDSAVKRCHIFHTKQMHYQYLRGGLQTKHRSVWGCFFRSIEITFGFTFFLFEEALNSSSLTGILKFSFSDTVVVSFDFKTRMFMNFFVLSFWNRSMYCWKLYQSLNWKVLFP